MYVNISMKLSYNVYTFMLHTGFYWKQGMRFEAQFTTLQINSKKLAMPVQVANMWGVSDFVITNVTQMTTIELSI